MPSACDCLSALRKLFYFPLLSVSVQWGCLLHQASVHDLFICVKTQQGGENTRPEQTGYHGWPTVWVEALLMLVAKAGWYLRQGGNKCMAKSICKCPGQQSSALVSNYKPWISQLWLGWNETLPASQFLHLNNPIDVLVVLWCQVSISADND